MSIRPGDTAHYWLTVRQHLAAQNLAALLGAWAGGVDFVRADEAFMAGQEPPPAAIPPIGYLTELALSCADILINRLNQPEDQPPPAAPGDLAGASVPVGNKEAPF